MMKQWIRFLCLSLLSIVTGIASAQDVIEISNVQQLKDFRDAVNGGNQYAGKTVKLTDDLDLSGEINWTPIGNLVAYPGQSFNGTFDGDGHTISNLTVNDNTPNHAVAGLFGSVVNGTIKNLTVKNVNITSTHYAGGIVAYTSNGPTIENCKVIGGTIKSTPELLSSGEYDNGNHAGGIMGYATAGSTINNCWVENVTITAYRDLGGIVGTSDGTVTNNTAKNVTVTQDLTNGYPGKDITTIGDIVGRGSAKNNVEVNGNIVIKSNPVAQIGETKYETIADAVAAANAGDVIEVIKAGDYKLPNLPKNVTIEGKADGVVFKDIVANPTNENNIASIPNGATFKNVAFEVGNIDYHGFTHAGIINMEGCTLNGKLFSYGDMNFTNCEFVHSGDYNMWVYGQGNVVYDGCTFTNNTKGKMLHLYCEDANQTHKVTVKNCKFVNKGELSKSAINVKATSGSNALQYELHLEGNNTYEGSFPTAVGEQDNSDHTWILSPLAQVDDRSVSPDNIKVFENDVLIYPVSYVAQIGDVKYETLAEAVAAAKLGDTIKLLVDLENTGNVSLPAGVTLDGDGKNITGTSAVYINKDGGTVQNVNFKNIHNETSKLSAIYGGNLAGTATITGCTFDNCDWDAIQITPVAGANVVITNNMFSDDVTDNVKQQRYIHVQSKQNVDFSATITENVMPGKLTQEPIGVYYPTDKAKIDLTKNYIESINDVCILVADNNGYAGELVFPAYTTAEKQETYSPVAMIQNGSYAANFYAKLQDAINAGEGKTVKLLADINLGENAANINKAVTIEGDGHTISSTATQAIAISGAGNVTINNTVVSAKNRGINVSSASTGFTLNVNNSTIQSQVSDPTTTYTTGNDSRGINVANADGVTVNITNSTIQGFSYDINIPGTGKNLTVNMTGGKTYGRAIVNNWGSNNNFTLNGVEVHGLNNQTGSTEAFSCIVENEGVKNNNYAILDCQFIATLSEAAMTAEGSTATEQMIDLRGTNSTVKVLGSTTYTCNSNERGGLVYNEGALFTNKLYFDDTTKATFADAFKEAVIADEKDAEVGLYPVTYTPEVYYYWIADGKEEGGYYHFAEPFTKGWLNDGEFIRLNKDVTLTSNLTWAKENASFTLTLGDYTVNKGDYSVSLKEGQSVNTDKQTDIFSAAANFKVVETAVDGGYTYTVAAKEYVAQIGEGENAVKYESLEEALAAISTVTTAKHDKSGLTINQYKANGTVSLLADCEGNGIVIDSGSELTIDFAGHTYSVTGDLVGSNGTESQGFQLLKNSNVTFKSTAAEPGSITSAKATFLVQNYSNLTLENMNLDGSNLNGSGTYTLSNNNGNVVINNSSITAKEGTGNFAFDVCRYSSYPSVGVTVTGESVINGNIEVSASKSDAKDGFKLMLEAGTLNGDIVLDASAKAAMAATPEKALVMKSETFTTDAPADYKWVAAEEGTLKLVPCEYVAQVGDNKFETLEAAFAAAQDGATITLLADCAGNGIKAPQGKFTTGLTVDFAGHTYTVDGTTVGSAGTETNGFQLLKDNKITFKNGTITSEKAKILIQNYSDLTLKGMTLTLNNENYTSAYTLSDNNGNVVVDETTINANPAGGFAFDVCRYADYPSVSVTVKGESVINGDIEVSASKSDAKDGFKLMLEAGTMTGNIVLDASAKAAMAATPEKATVSKSNTLTAIAAPDGYKWVDNGNGTSTLAPAHYIAAIGDEKYETLQEAINACEAGAETTIKLLVDVEDGSAFEIADSKKNANLNIIIDFDNHSYNVTKNAVGSARTKSQAMHFASGNTLTLKNGTISSAATSEENNLKMMMQNYCDLTLDGMTIDCSNINGGTYPDYSGTTYEYWSLKSVPVFNFNTGNATIKNTTISFRDGDNVGLCVDGGTVALGEGVVVNGAVSAVSGSVTITDGKYSGAVTADQATLKISGGVFTKVPADEYCADGFIVTENTDDATKKQYPYTVKSKEEAGIYELIDGTPYPESLRANGGHAKEVTYTHKFAGAVYSCWWVPFNYTISDDDAAKFDFYTIHMIAGSKTSGEIEETGKIWIYLSKQKSGKLLKAGHIYVIKPKEAINSYTFKATDVDLLSENSTTSRKHTETSDYAYDFFGTYVGYETTKPNDVMWLSKNGTIDWNLSAGAKLGSYRWFIRVTSKTGSDDADAKITIGFKEDEGDTDGINNAQASEGEIEGIYTLGGMKVEHPVKGVNIIKYTDGRTKKIYVK